MAYRLISGFSLDLPGPWVIGCVQEFGCNNNLNSSGAFARPALDVAGETSDLISEPDAPQAMATGQNNNMVITMVVLTQC